MFAPASKIPVPTPLYPTTLHDTPPDARRARRWVCTLLTAGLVACASNSTDPEQYVARQKQLDTESLNMQLAAAAGRQSASPAALEEYRVGPGDVLEIAVFQVEELNLKVRVNGRGTVIVPLLGEVGVGDRTTAEVEEMVAAELGERYLHDPQVSVFVAEYRSRQITVMGSVKEPAVHSVQRPHTVLELLSMSGGLNEKAGYRIHVQTAMLDADSGRPEPRNLVIDLKSLLESGDAAYNLVLRGGDSVYVPQAGVVFVEGAVRKPGAYQMQGETNVLKAIAMAGGSEYEAKEGSIQVFRSSEDDAVIEVDLKAVRAKQVPDVLLQDGDIVVVGSNILKQGFAGFWRGITGLFSFQKGL